VDAGVDSKQLLFDSGQTVVAGVARAFALGRGIGGNVELVSGVDFEKVIGT
jgi:hypothetical protein